MTRRRGAAAALLLTTLLLTACSAKGTTMTPAAARQDFESLFQSTLTAAGASHAAWQVIADTGAQACDLPGGGSGAQWYRVVRGPGDSDPKAVAERVRTLFGEHGLAADVRPYSADDVRVVGTDRASAVFDFEVRADRMSLQAQSSCFEGDAAALNAE